MPRANRIFCAGHIWHITHRCHQREFLLKFQRDRRRWRHWLFEARRRYGLSVLNYIATSNHIHLLCADQGRDEIPRSLQLIQGRVAREYNARKNRRGAFWEDRYHATAVQADDHLARCMTYIDLNMVRANAVAHPREWEVCGFNEILCPPWRKRIIDFPALFRLLNVETYEHLATMRNHLVHEEVGRTRRAPAWTESVAVGDEAYLEQVKNDLGLRGKHKRIVTEKGIQALSEAHPAYWPVLGPKTPD